MEYKLIYLKKVGMIRFGGRNIKHYDKYNSLDEIPLFFSDQTPITEGLKLLENKGNVIIADADKVEEVVAGLEGEEESTEDSSSETVVDKTEDDIAPEGDTTSEEESNEEETTDDGEGETDDNQEEETKSEEVEGSTEEELNELTSSELDDICREEGISGYSTRDKEGKIELILNNQ